MIVFILSLNFFTSLSSLFSLLWLCCSRTRDGQHSKKERKESYIYCSKKMARRWTRGHCLALTAVRSLSPAQLSRLFFFCCTWYSLRSTGDIPMASSLQGCDQRLSKEHFLIVTSYAREKRERGHPRKT